MLCANGRKRQWRILGTTGRINTNHSRQDVGLLVVIGDLNAGVSEDNTGRRERATGAQGFGCANNNGEIPLSLYVERKLALGVRYLCIERSTNYMEIGKPKYRLSNRSRDCKTNCR